MDNKEILKNALEFHGHRCWASAAGVRVVLTALEKLGVKRSGGTQHYGIVGIGEEHGGMCFGDAYLPGGQVLFRRPAEIPYIFYKVGLGGMIPQCA